MKKVLLFLLLPLAALAAPCLLRAQSVAINADSSAADPSAILDLKSTIKGFLAPRMTMAQRNLIAAPAVGLLVYQTDSTAGYYCYNGAGWHPLGGSDGSGGSGGSDSSSGGGLKDTLWKVTGTNITNGNSGYVGIGTTTPIYPLSIKTSPSYGFGFGLSHTDGTVTMNTFVGAGAYLDQKKLTPTGGWLGTQSNHPLYFYAHGGRPAMTIKPDINGPFVGIGTDSPVTRLQIGTLAPNSLFVNTAAVAIALNASTMSIEAAPYNGDAEIACTKNLYLMPGWGSGNIGINVDDVSETLRNKLQIGTVGSSGYNGNDLLIGNNGQAFAIAQLADKTQIASTTTVELLAPLEVRSTYKPAALSGSWTIFSNGPDAEDHDNDISSGPTPYGLADISILATGTIYAEYFAAFSDRRIKNLLGTSDAKKDLVAINALRIRDYTMKDKLKYGEGRFKKVIAQEVEQVYPQVVSRHADLIPNVYQVTDTIARSSAGYVFHFKREHHIGDTARKLQVITKRGIVQSYDIVSIPNTNEVVVNGPEINTNNIFVYGEEVPDFRTVDYEGLTTLNISATQEISREVDELKKALASANENIRVLARAVRRLSRRPTGNRLASSRYTPSTHTNQTKKI